MNPRFVRAVLTAIAVLPFISTAVATETETAFTYQGQLKEGGRPLDGTADFRFTLWDAPAGGTQVGAVQTVNAIPVTSGLLTVTLNAGGEFGSEAFNGNPRWVQVAVRSPAGFGAFATLSPRQPITATPYALRAALGVGPPGVLDLTPTGQLNLANNPGTGKASQMSLDASMGTMWAFNDVGTMPLTIGSRSANGDKTQIRLDDATSSVTIFKEVASPNTAGITPPPKLRIDLEAATANTAGAEAGVSIAAYDADGYKGALLRLRSGDLDTMSVTPAGRVGIRTNAPAEALDVVGNVHASGTIKSGGSITIDGTSGNERISSSASLDLRTAAGRALRLENHVTSPNLIGGHSGNTVTAGAYGATIGGGGSTLVANRVTDQYGTVGGGRGNQAGDNDGITGNRTSATVGGGFNNTAGGGSSTVGGGQNNYAGSLCVGGANDGLRCTSGIDCLGGTCPVATYSTIGGGINNAASGEYATVGGGSSNDAGGRFSTIPGGSANTASGNSATVGGGNNNHVTGDSSTVSGGSNNIASAGYSTVPGGNLNEATALYSFAAGRQAKANHQGTFVWHDGLVVAGGGNDFVSTDLYQFLIHANGGVGIGTNDPMNMQFRVEDNGGTPAGFNRTVSDGTVIAIQQNGTTEGTISVSGTTVSYNAFTGSHYGWTNENLERGTLVVITGDNRRRHESSPSEPIYGIAASVAANDPRCLGAYLSLQEPGQPQGPDNPHLVMAVGNGEMWVVDTGRNIEPGAYLISSDVRGHAMLDDDAKFSTGHIMARAGEPVDWSKTSDTIDDRKHQRISVFFENFERGSAVGLGRIVEEQEKRIEVLNRRLSELEAGCRPQFSVATAGMVCFGLGAMTLGGRALQRRLAKGGSQ